ncbi:hypothetical protein M1466_01355 [Candidatus Dependentiae bacterium]|nr:hypothetical protein [Candidatus Dependentiae bacterium]
MIGNTHRLLIVWSIVAIHYCNSADVLISNNANDLINYVTSHPTEAALRVKFADSIPPAKRTAILNDSFNQLAKKTLTRQIIKLSLANNKLQQPPVLTGLSALLWLDLSNNQLKTAPRLTDLSALQWLFLGNNKLTTAPDLAGLAALQELFLQESQLTTPLYIPAALKEQLQVYGYTNLIYENSVNQ